MTVRIPPLALAMACMAASVGAGCRSVGTPAASPPAAVQAPRRALGPEMFRHHFVTRDIPSDRKSGFAAAVMTDFDGDGRLDYVFGSVTETLFWFRFVGWGTWERKPVGLMGQSLGGTPFDVDGDGRTDIVTGQYWYRNGADGEFRRHEYDPEMTSEVHDAVIADVDGDNRGELVAVGDHAGLFWYDIPEGSAAEGRWDRVLVTDDVLKENEGIHSGFFPRGVGDLDGDGDADIVAARYMYLNQEKGRSWIRVDLPFSRKRGPWGWSARSWIVDLDRDGMVDIVMTDSDQSDSRAAVLFGQGGSPPTFRVEPLPTSATGTRGSFHSLGVADLDADGDLDVLTVEQEDPHVFPVNANPRWYVWENLDGKGHRFAERVIFDGGLGGHDALIGDVDGDGDLDICAKIWARWPGNANEGREHGDCFENLLKSPL